MAPAGDACPAVRRQPPARAEALRQLQAYGMVEIHPAAARSCAGPRRARCARLSRARRARGPRVRVGVTADHARWTAPAPRDAAPVHGGCRSVRRRPGLDLCTARARGHQRRLPPGDRGRGGRAHPGAFARDPAPRGAAERQHVRAAHPAPPEREHRSTQRHRGRDRGRRCRQARAAMRRHVLGSGELIAHWFEREQREREQARSRALQSVPSAR